MRSIVLVLHNIRSVYNVGSIFRTAEAAGAEKIYLTGYTPSPLDRFGRQRRDFSKTALGAEKTVKWRKISSLADLLTKLKKEKTFIIGLEQSRQSVDYRKIKPRPKTALIVGNEILGLNLKILAKCDLVAEIPMRGKKESLNVAVALGIALFRILDL